jgi:hypothetical protein
VKQKRQAYAAFLGVMSVLGKVVGVCCIPTTILTDFGASGPPPDVHSTAEKTGLTGLGGKSNQPSLAGRPHGFRNKKAAATGLRP